MTADMTAMPYQVDIQKHDKYVRVHVKGERRYGDAAVEAAQVGRQIVEYCRVANIYRVMVILDLNGRLSAIDSLEMVAGSQQYGWDHSFKLAFVVTNAGSIEDVKFTESIATDREYAVKAVTEEAEAVDWLMDEPA
jgi:hypothetical protein